MTRRRKRNSQLGVAKPLSTQRKARELSTETCELGFVLKVKFRLTAQALSPNSLKHIKDMGFKTFEDFWDETYDLEVDDKKRFTMIVSLIETIAKWTEEEKTQFTFKVKDIVDYNVAHLNTMQDIEIDNLIEKYGV
jgi:hypothetical protein